MTTTTRNNKIPQNPRVSKGANMPHQLTNIQMRLLHRANSATDARYFFKSISSPEEREAVKGVHAQIDAILRKNFGMTKVSTSEGVVRTSNHGAKDGANGFGAQRQPTVKAGGERF